MIAAALEDAVMVEEYSDNSRSCDEEARVGSRGERELLMWRIFIIKSMVSRAKFQRRSKKEKEKKQDVKKRRIGTH